jgi:hypothetical protein
MALVLACAGTDADDGATHSPSGRQVQPGGRPAARAAEGEILVKFRPGTGKERIDALLKEMGYAMLRPLSGGDLYLIKVPAAVSLDEALGRLSSCPEVAYAEPNYMRLIKESRP